MFHKALQTAFSVKKGYFYCCTAMLSRALQAIRTAGCASILSVTMVWIAARSLSCQIIYFLDKLSDKYVPGLRWVMENREKGEKNFIA